MAQLVLAKQATFDKPAKNRHMRPLYLKGYVNGKPLIKMFVHGGAAVNVMPYTTFRKLGMGPEDLTPTSIILNDFARNPSDTKGCVHVDLMIGSKTLLMTFFVIEGKGAYSLLLELIAGMKVLLNLSAVINSRFKQSALIVIFNGQSC
jgi:hypothetical protein